MALSEPIQIPFLGEWNQLRRERHEVRERLARLDFEEGKFSEAVLARVRLDYERRMHDLEARASDLAERARREVSTLSGAVDQQEHEVLDCRLGLEEFELREKLGERLDPETARKAAERRAVARQLEDDLRAMRELLDRVRAIAEGRTGSQPWVSVSGRESSRPAPAAANDLLAAAPAASPAPPEPPPAVAELLSAIPLHEPLPPYLQTAPVQIVAIPRLVPVESADSSDHFALRAKTIVGRTADCDLRLPVGTVSRRHAEIECSGERWHLHDLQSENGTWVNSERVWDRELVDGDRIQFGTVCLVFKST